MSATIIPFPNSAAALARKAFLRRLAEALRPSEEERREIEGRRKRSRKWTAQDRHLFDHFKRCDGLSDEEAAERVETAIYIRREVHGEDESARMLRMARESMAQLKKLR